VTARLAAHIAFRANAIRTRSIDLLFTSGEPAWKELLFKYSDKSYSFPAHEKTAFAATGAHRSYIVEQQQVKRKFESCDRCGVQVLILRFGIVPMTLANDRRARPESKLFGAFTALQGCRRHYSLALALTSAS
jgi:hypothetical protein